MIREVAPNFENVQYLVDHMRERDRREIMALRWDDDINAFGVEVMNFAGPMWRVWEKDGVPVALGGVTPMRPGVVLGGLFGTADWHYALRHIMTWGRRWVIPRLLASGTHRGECYALAANTDSRKFIEACGGEIESLLHQYGREREDFILYAWRFDDVHRWRRLRRGASNTAGKRPTGPGPGNSPRLH